MDLNVLILIVVLAAVFLGIRAFWWWYWGIGRAVAALEDIAESLRTFPTVRAYNQQTKRQPLRTA